MSTREQAIAALLARIAAAYPWAAPPARRLRLWSDVPPSMRPACFLFEGGAETYAHAETPAGADNALGRNTLNGAAYRCGIQGKPLKDPGDLDGDGLLVVPIRLVLP